MRAPLHSELCVSALPGFDIWHGSAAQILAEPGLLPPGLTLPTDRRAVVAVHAGLSVLVRRLGPASAGRFRVERATITPGLG